MFLYTSQAVSASILQDYHGKSRRISNGSLPGSAVVVIDRRQTERAQNRAGSSRPFTIRQSLNAIKSYLWAQWPSGEDRRAWQSTRWRQQLINADEISRPSTDVGGNERPPSAAKPCTAERLIAPWWRDRSEPDTVRWSFISTDKAKLSEKERVV